MKSHRALMIMEPGQVSNLLLSAWLECGNTVSEIWTRNRNALKGNPSERLAALARGVPTVGILAKRHGIPVRILPPLTPTSDTWSLAQTSAADTLITCMTFQIIPQHVIASFGERTINVHPAVLPHYRGKNPKVSMLIDGKAESFGGITFHVLTRRIDQGPIIAQRRVPWSLTLNFQLWTDALALAAADMVKNEIQQFLAGRLKAVPQSPESGNYRKCLNGEFAITAGRTLDEVRHLFDSAPGLAYPWCPQARGGDSRSFPVLGLRKVVSRPTGAPPRIGLFRIETDLSDARIRLQRQTSWHRLVRHPFQAFFGYRGLLRKKSGILSR